MLVTTDMLLDGVHFHISDCGPRLAGRKALAVNLSDIAAMAGEPRTAVVSLALPRGAGAAYAEAIMAGIAELAAHFGVAIVGGDTNSWHGPTVINIAVHGSPTGTGPVLRSTAQAGDLILVTGKLGGSLASGRHLNFTPRCREALALHRRGGLTSMIDLSDGLATDLGHVVRASGLKAVLDPDLVPMHSDVAHAPRSRSEQLARALGDGEDFELCFTMRPDSAKDLVRSQPLGATSITIIGEMHAGSAGIWWKGATSEADGKPISIKGFEHRF